MSLEHLEHDRLGKFGIGGVPTPEPEPPYRPNPEPDTPEPEAPRIDPEKGVVVPVRLPGHPSQPVREHASCNPGHFS